MALIVGLFILGLMYIVKADYGSDGEWHGSIVPRQAIDNPGRIATRQDSMQIMPIHIEDNVLQQSMILLQQNMILKIIIPARLITQRLRTAHMAAILELSIQKANQVMTGIGISAMISMDI
jgi:hypothetical protein